MAIYPFRFSSDSSLGPEKPKNKSKRGVGQMACKKSSAKKTSTKKTSSKKKPC